MTPIFPTTPDPLAGHTVMQMLDVAMSSIIGDTMTQTWYRNGNGSSKGPPMNMSV